MLIKFLAAWPLAALFGYITGFVEGVSLFKLEQTIIEFVALGRIPATETYVSFDVYLVGIIGLAWLCAVGLVLKQAKNLIDRRLELSSQLELISL